MSTETFWNGEKCKARLVIVIVGVAPAPTWWCADLIGQQREAVEIHYGSQTFYIDNEAWQEQGRINVNLPAGHGWQKVTSGKGSPALAHRSLPVERVLREISNEQ